MSQGETKPEPGPEPGIPLTEEVSEDAVNAAGQTLCKLLHDAPEIEPSLEVDIATLVLGTRRLLLRGVAFHYILRLMVDEFQSKIALTISEAVKGAVEYDRKHRGGGKGKYPQNH